MRLPSYGSSAWILLSFVLFIALGCQRFYLPVKAPSDTAAEKEQVIRENNTQRKYFILRHGPQAYALSQLEVDQQHQQLKARLGSLPPQHERYAQARPKYNYRTKYAEEGVLNEVHLYLPATAPLDTAGVISLPLDSIRKIEVIEFDRGRTTTSYILGGVGYTVGAVAVAAVIVALTKSSCPFVGVYDGQQYVMQGELFGGAIYPSLAREDYLPLRTTPLDGGFQLRISNELQERQYTDYADLLVVTHDPDVRALTDRSGRIYTVGVPEAPVKAILNERHDVTESLLMADKWQCLFNDTAAKENINELVLHFNRPAAQKQARLLLQLQNSYWFDYLYGEFTSAFGSYYNHWVKKQKKAPVEELEQWSLDQHIPLCIELKTKDGWKQVEQLRTIGPVASREVLVPLDLQDVDDDEVVVRLSTGFMFWEVDFAGIDYSPERPYIVQVLKPFEGVDEKGNNVLPVLLQPDQKYLDQPVPGNAAVLKYKLAESAAAGQGMTVVLHTRGYYEHVRRYRGKPQLAFLKGFKEAGAFAAFSRQRYEQVRLQNIIALNH